MHWVADDRPFAIATTSLLFREQPMKENALLSALSRRQLLKGAASTAAVLSAGPFIGSGMAQSRSEAVPGRLREDFDFGWKFRSGDFPGAEMPEFSESDWRTLNLPHDWSIEGAFDEMAPSSA